MPPTSVVERSTGTKTKTKNAANGTRKRPASATLPSCPETDPLCRTLTLLDPILQFLTRATGQSLVPVKNLLATIPRQKISLEHVQSLVAYGILQISPLADSQLQEEWKRGNLCDSKYMIGFPNPDEQRLSGSTKTGAKRRLAYLKRQLKASSKKSKSTTPSTENRNDVAEGILDDENEGASRTIAKDWSLPTEDDPEFVEEPILEKEMEARRALKDLLDLEPCISSDDGTSDTIFPTRLLPKQVSYAGTQAAQEACFDHQNQWQEGLDPRIVNCVKQKLYRHQAIAIESASRNIPTMVCTGTGSGKSLCFLIPVLNAALCGEKSLLLFPTKALAQDQVGKLNSWIKEHSLDQHIHAATLDGDTPHSQRLDIISSCNVILTNPDTLHAAILPNWKHLYRPLLINLRYVVIDEAHMYTGVFGAHVSMILARLYRIISLQTSQLCFLACSATLAHPDAHFRLLCCMSKGQAVNIIKEDGSPRAAKHFWVWNPPLLDLNGKSLCRVVKKRTKAKAKEDTKLASGRPSASQSKKKLRTMDEGPLNLSLKDKQLVDMDGVQHRRHSADETALLLALAVSKGVRCIAFCKTRGLVEWVYERTMQALKSSPKTAELCNQVESYRGGYTKAERRLIEEKLFNNNLLGVVGTSALELGVDIGGVDLTLHCGFPTSHENLIQQSGRAGRGANASTSLAICVCFNSPMDQHLWRHPSSLLSRGYSAPLSMPIYPGLVQGHLLCAGQEYPLTGSLNVLAIQSTEKVYPKNLLSDMDLFGSADVYEEALETLLCQGSITEEKLAITAEPGTAVVYKTHPSIKNPWSQVSIRSIEPVSYQIVDSSHPNQGGRTDGIHDEAAVLDTIPYSRVFYHAFPGAIITHRNRRYKIVGMTRPPAFGKGFRGSISLGAFAKPCDLRYYTRPLSSLHITVVKQMERIDVPSQRKSPSLAIGTGPSTPVAVTPPAPDVAEAFSTNGPDPSFGAFAGCGVVTVKRNVHGYKKLSIVTREEISRSELSLPDMEFDTFAFWLDCDAELLCPQLGDTAYGHGVHAVAHACVAVAPLFVPCTAADVQCDHSVYGPTRVTIFDSRAGGSGICAQLWKCVFVPDGLFEKALALLEECPSCADDKGYEGGCPACLQAGECIKFNDYLSKSSGIVIAKHIIKRIKETPSYKIKNGMSTSSVSYKEKEHGLDSPTSIDGVASPRRTRRERAMRHAQDMVSARDRQVVVGRPSWPMDRSDGPRGQETHD